MIDVFNLRIWLAMLSSVAAADQSFAQQNTLRIEQSGDYNTLVIDQSKASYSTVGGVNLGASHQSFAAISTTTEFGVDPSPTGSTTASSNPFSPELSSLVDTDIARQVGASNSATVTVGGVGGSARFLQDSSGFSEGNSAIVTALDGSNVVLGQVGFGNSAEMTVQNGGAGGVLQRGNRNHADLSVTGVGSAGLISQIGNNNDTGLSVSGAGTAVSYTVVGSNLQSVTPGGLAVTADNAAVQVTQMAMPGISNR